MLTHFVSERHLVCPVSRMALATGIEGALGELVTGRPVEAAWHFPEPELALRLSEGPLDPRVILPPLPSHTGLGVDAVDDDVNVSVLAVTVRNEHRLVLLQP